ncbi:MAG: NlpC/P60 family protein [Gaiellaceae bacterium]
MTDAQLEKAMKQGGIVNPTATLSAAREVMLALPYACALLEQETSGGHNVFGHDNVRNPIKGGDVTKSRYAEYKRFRDLGLGANGVGPTQLTWPGYQDRADALGGCWDYGVNLRVGFSILRANIRQSGVYRGFWNYNGSEAYAKQVMPRVGKWQTILTSGSPQPAPSPPPPPTKAVGAAVGDFVGLCLGQRGDRYQWGAKPPASDPNPTAFDCSGLVWWALARLRVSFPQGSWLQLQECIRRRSLIQPLGRAFTIQGALLFRHHTAAEGHVAVSLGNGSTIEARGRLYGVNEFPAARRDWTHAAYVPGLRYGPPPARAARWPGRYLMQPPPLRGSDVRRWQELMCARGWTVAVDGVYGPQSEAVCCKFQAEVGVSVDGVVGPETWHAAVAAPVA